MSRVNIDYGAFESAYDLMDSFNDPELLSKRSRIHREKVEDALRRKEKQELLDAGLTIASLFVLPGISEVASSAKLAEAGAKEVVKQGAKEVVKKTAEEAGKQSVEKVAESVVSDVVTKEGVKSTKVFTKAFWEKENLKAVGKSFKRGALRQTSPSDLYKIKVGDEELMLNRNIIESSLIFDNPTKRNEYLKLMNEMEF